MLNNGRGRCKEFPSKDVTQKITKKTFNLPSNVTHWRRIKCSPPNVTHWQRIESLPPNVTIWRMKCSPPNVTSCIKRRVKTEVLVVKLCLDSWNKFNLYTMYTMYTMYSTYVCYVYFAYYVYYVCYLTFKYSPSQLSSSLSSSPHQNI